MKTLRLVFGDQLSLKISSLKDFHPSEDVVLMVESLEENTRLRHHKQKITLVLSAMRHFADQLRQERMQVDYVTLDTPDNSGTFTGEVERAFQRHSAKRLILTEPSEWRVREMISSWKKRFDIPVEEREDDRFLCSKEDFNTWASGRKSLRMEYFYRTMRQNTGWLMDGGQPLGGQWNYDADNRKALPEKIKVPEPLRFTPDGITREVMRLVRQHFGDHFGDLESFSWAVTRDGALNVLAHFIDHGLPGFGEYQDAMKSGQDFIFHSALSPYINIGLLNPGEVCEAALSAYENGQVSLASTEGFVRQILGWREFLHGIYWLKMPDYARSNYLGAVRPLPDFYWTAATEMNCLRETIRSTMRNSYAHHIQRLMVTGNFALLAGCAPAEVEEWYRIVYADAFDWVELPNVHGMALYADGGLLASKPYAASGAYLERMSDYCAGCAYNPREKLGEQACPYNYLYWHFFIRNENVLRGNPRLALAYRTVDGMPEERRQQICKQAGSFLDQQM